MKKIIAAIMALVMLCAVSAVAESVSIEDQAKDIISIVNYFVKENSEMEQLFVGYQEVVDDQIFGFFTEDNSIQSLLVANVEENSIDSCSFICDIPQVLPLAFNCANVLPFAQILSAEDDAEADAIQADMIALAKWFDANYTDVVKAFESATAHGVSFMESEFFRADVMIAPLDEGARLMVTYYFEPAADEAAE